MVKIVKRGSEKEYQCEGCGKIFYNYGTTNNHEKWECSELGKTQNEREKNRQEDYWICDGCSKEFKTKFETIEHEKNCRQYLEAKKAEEAVKKAEEAKSNLTQWPFDLKDNEKVVLAKHNKSSWGSKSVAWWGPMEVGGGDIFVGIFSGGATIPNREGDWHAGSFYLTNQRIIFQGTNKATNLIIDLIDVDSFLFKDLQGNERKVIGEGETHLFVSEEGEPEHKFSFGFPQEAREVQKQLVSYNQEVTIQKAKHSEKVLDYKKAIMLWEKIGKHDDAKRIREIVMKGQARTVVHGDYVDDRDTTIQDSVVSKSNVGAGGKSKAEEIKEIKELLDSGAIDDDEFKQMKKEILGK